MSDKKSRSRKFVTTILIGGALGSLFALLFRNTSKRKIGFKERIDEVLRQGEKEKKNETLWRRWFVVFLLFLLGLGFIFSAEAKEQFQYLMKEKKIQFEFNEKNPAGTIDLKSIVDQELTPPEDCQQTLVLCTVESIFFEIQLKKKWKRLNLQELSSSEFAEQSPRIEHATDQLTREEVALVQEVLARRGLLTYPDGKPVQERGYYGPLTQMALLRLAHVKGLNPGDPSFYTQLRDQINQLLDRMAKDQDYGKKNPLPHQEHLEPKPGDPLSSEWKHQQYLADLAQKATRKDPGNIPLKGSIEMKLDGYVEVETIENRQ